MKNKGIKPSGALLLLISTAAVKLIGALFKIPLANLLGDSGFGRFSSVYDLFTPFYALAMTGLPVAAATVYSSETDVSARESLFRISKRLFRIFGTCAVSLYILFIPFMLRLAGGDTSALLALLAVAPAVLLFFLISYYRGWYEGQNNMLPTAVSDVIEAVGKLVLGLGLGALVMRLSSDSNIGAAAVLFGITLGVFAAWVWLTVSSKGSVPASPGINKESDEKLRRRLLSASASIGISALLLSVPASLTDALTIRPMLKIASEQLGKNAQLLYGVRGREFTLFNLIPAVSTAVGVSAVPQLSSAAAAGDKRLLRERTGLLLKISACIALPSGLGMTALSAGINSLLYGGAGHLQTGSRMLAIYGAAAVFAGIAIPAVQALQAIGKKGAALIILSVSTLVKLAGNLLLVSQKDINIYGAAISTCLLYFSALVPALVILSKHTGGFNAGAFLRPAAAAVPAVSAAVLISRFCPGSLAVAAAVIAAVIVFVAAIWSFRVFSEKELALIFGGKSLFKR